MDWNILKILFKLCEPFRKYNGRHEWRRGGLKKPTSARTHTHSQPKQMNWMTKQYFSFQIKHRNFSNTLLLLHWLAVWKERGREGQRKTEGRGRVGRSEKLIALNLPNNAYSVNFKIGPVKWNLEYEKNVFLLDGIAKLLPIARTHEIITARNIELDECV